MQAKQLNEEVLYADAQIVKPPKGEGLYPTGWKSKKYYLENKKLCNLYRKIIPLGRTYTIFPPFSAA